MQEVFEKIIEEIKEKSYEIQLDGAIVASTKKVAEVPDIVDIVNTISEECNNGWIPVSECLPKEHDSMFARFKGTTKWNDSMFEKISNEVNVTVSDGKGDRATTHAHTVDRMWSCDFLNVNKKYRVIAWQPLPAPYQPKGE